MLSFRKKQSHTVAEIKFGADSDVQTDIEATEHWLSTDDVTGWAVFKLPVGVDYTHSRINLKGAVTVKIDDYPQGALQRSWRTETLKFLSITLDCTPRTEFKIDNSLIRIPFCFKLSDSQSYSSSISELPPSLDSKEEGRWWASLKKYDSDCQWSVSYSITASAFSGRKIVASTTRRISVLPVSHVQPPVYTNAFPSEYFLAATTTHGPKKLLSKAITPRIEVAGQEPSPIVLKADSSISSGSTEVPLVLKIISGRHSLPTQFHLKAHLTTKTLVTPNGMGRVMPTIEQARYGEDSHVALNKSQDQEYTIAIPKWDKISSNANSESSDDDFSITRLSFLFTTANQTPTFFTPLLSRRHSLELTLAFPGGSGKVSLSLPLQIVYQTKDSPISYIEQSRLK